MTLEEHAQKSQGDNVSIPDCLTCGLCCSPGRWQNVFVDLENADVKRLNPKWVEKNVFGAAIKAKWREQKSGPLQGRKECVCVALRGSLLHRVRCSIYAQRPRACRVTLQPGDRLCLETRRLYQQALDREETRKQATLRLVLAAIEEGIGTAGMFPITFFHEGYITALITLKSNAVFLDLVSRKEAMKETEL